MSELHEALLRGLAPGGVMWLKAAGNSLWPLLRDGDSLKVERVSEAQLHLGEVALVKLPSGILAAHLVAGLAPLRTASSVGVLDPLPLEALGRVVGFRRDGVERDWPAWSRLALRFLPVSARALKRVPLSRRLVRRLRG
jgi:hypothetical protein